MKKLLFLICLTFFIIPIHNQAQTNFTDIIKQKTDNYIINNFPEKVYIQTDKPIYVLDEDIWFSAYLVNGITHSRTSKSRILYVELISPQNKIVAKKKIFIHNISAPGDFKINKNWKAGIYTLRGYTNYMRNSDANLFFEKKIPIYKIDNDNVITETPSILSLQENVTKNPHLTQNISFYPEGGYLIEGLQTKVAFKTKQKKDFIGILKDQDNNEIATIKSIDIGLGLFSFIPEVNKSYHVSTLVNGKEVKHNLPKALPNGYVLSTTNMNKDIVVTINSNTPNGLKNTYLVAHQRGILFYENFEEKNINSSSIRIPSVYLADGVVNITLFNRNGNPVAERTVFVDNPNNNLKLTAETTKKTYSSNEKVDLTLNLTNINGVKEVSTLSMAIRDLKAFPYNTRNKNIKTYLLLNSDIRGEVKNPGYFFEKENDAKRKYLLDLVMMSNGWKRFTWQELLQSEEKEQKYKPETSIYISGTTTKLKRTNKPHVSEVKLLFLGNVLSQEPVQTTDDLGRFSFGPYTFMDSIPTRIDARYDHFGSTSLKTRSVKIILDEPKPSAPITNKNNSINIPINKHDSNFVKITQYVQQIKFEYNEKVEKLKVVELSIKKESDAKKRIMEMEKRTIYGKQLSRGNRVDISNLEFTPTTVIDVINTNLTHIVREDIDNFLWNRDNSVAMIFLDGRQIDMNTLRGITCDEISFVDILTGPTTNIFVQKIDSGDGTGNAAILLYSKKSHEYKASNKQKPGSLNFYAKGFYTAREFAAPDHINGFDEINKKDVRTTLHWEPRIITSSKAPTEISFFTGDLKSDYIIEIEGISAKGQPIHTITTFNVE